MTTGKQLAGLLLLSTALTFPGIALAQETPDNQQDEGLPDQIDSVDGGEDQVEQPDISVAGGNTIIVTGRINRDPTRNSTQVISVLSTEQIARTGEGDIAGALSRVTGLSVVGEGRVYVRGLGDRYSLALLNGLPLPSPEPLSRVVPLDIFPTNVVASSLVQKTYSPNFPGEFGGGVINLTTRAVPEETFLTISGGLSGDTETTFQNGYAYYGSEMDWTGFDSGVRDLPPALQNYLTSSINDGTSLGDLSQAQIEDIGRVLTPPRLSTLQIIGDLRPNFSMGLTAGTALDIGDDARLGLIATANLSNSWRNRSISRQTAGLATDTLLTDSTNFVTENHMLANAMFSAGLEFGDHVIRWTNLFIRDTVKQASLAAYKNFDPDFAAVDFLDQNTGWYERQLIDTQLVGEFEFGRLSVDVRGGYARTDREAPYNLSYIYARTNDPNDLYGDLYRVDLSGSGQQALQRTAARVSFSDLNEELWFGGLDLTYEILDNLQATVGYAYSDTSRYSERRGFQLRASVDTEFLNPGGDPNIPPLDPSLFPVFQQILAAVGTRTPGLLFNAATFNMFDVNLLETGSTTPAFGAALTIHAGYGQLQWIPIDTLTVQGGVRFETATQSSTPIGVNNLGSGNVNKQDYWLPALTITWEPMDDLQLRASASKTIARPQFRELVAQTYYDPESGRSYSGNPELVDSKLTNLEARAEYYFGRRSSASIAGFYKKIDKPIEALFSESTITYANATEATLYGAELDAQYNFDLASMGGWFETKQLVLIANYTYTQSKLNVGDELVPVYIGSQPQRFPASQIFTDGAPMIGQSDHLVNFQIGLEDLDILQQFTMLVSYASERPTFRGVVDQLPDVVEKPGVQLDLVARQGFNLGPAEAELKLEARNLLGTRHQEYQINTTGLRIENNTYDIGQSFSASLSITF